MLDKMEPGHVTESRTMNTPLLAAIAFGPQNLSLISDFLGPKVNADLHAKDGMGRGYLRIAFDRLGFLRAEEPDDHEKFDFDYQSELLALLLSADKNFRERAIRSEETPRLIELAFSAVAWDVWTSVFEKLEWDMEEMNTYRYKILQRPMSDHLAPYEEARVQMLGQTRLRLGPDRVKELVDD